MLILASKSPRRKELLSVITNDFEIKTAYVDEALPKGITPKNAVEYLSKIKAMPFKKDGDVIIGSDTVVAVDDKILGKPHSEEEAFKMLKLLGGREHSVFTGVTILSAESEVTFSVQTKVKFIDLTDNDISEYIKTGEPFDKAGAYGIQGKGSLLVEKIHGDYFNVVGLPISKLAIELKKFNI